jgi:hypothetical protein
MYANSSGSYSWGHSQLEVSYELMSNSQRLRSYGDIWNSRGHETGVEHQDHSCLLQHRNPMMCSPFIIRSIVSWRGSHCFFLSGHKQLRGDTLRLSDHRLIPNNQRHLITGYQLPPWTVIDTRIVNCVYYVLTPRFSCNPIYIISGQWGPVTVVANSPDHHDQSIRQGFANSGTPQRVD